MRLLHQADPDLTLSAFSALVEAIKTSTDLVVPHNTSPSASLEQRTRQGLLETAARALEVLEMRIGRAVMDEVGWQPDQANDFAIGTQTVLTTLETALNEVEGVTNGFVWQEGIDILLRIIQARELPRLATRLLPSSC